MSAVISIDGMGGDHAPGIVISGLEAFAVRRPEFRFIVHGDEAALSALMKDAPVAAPRTTLRHTDKVVGMDMKPSQALRQGKGSSMWNAIESVRSGEASAAVSAGNTGALMAISKLTLRMAEGVHRPALIATMPTTTGGVSAMLDLGADISADAAQLVEFAIMGAAFVRAVHGKPDPSIGLLNVGSEDMKGDEELKEAAQMLRDSPMGLRFSGFVEGDDIVSGHVDVIVTDGFTGNVSLKMAEGVARMLSTSLKENLSSSLLSKIGALLAMPALRRFQARFDPRRTNGAVFVGLNGLVVKSHGGTDGFGFSNAIEVAANLSASNFKSEVQERLLMLVASQKSRPSEPASEEAAK